MWVVESGLTQNRYQFHDKEAAIYFAVKVDGWFYEKMDSQTPVPIGAVRDSD